MATQHGTYAVHGGNEKKRNYGTYRCGAHFMRMQTELKTKTDEELIEISKEKAPNGCATEYAIEASKTLYKGVNTAIDSNHRIVI